MQALMYRRSFPWNAGEVRGGGACRLLTGMLLMAGGLMSASAASLAFDENRYILEQGRPKVAVTIDNRGEEAALVQVSLDWAEPSQDADQEVPLAVSKPLRQIAADQSTTVEVFYQGLGLPKDRESAFFLNILDVPMVRDLESETAIPVRLAARHRLKLFYRPILAMSPELARDALRWSRVDKDGRTSVTAENTSPYFVTMVEIGAIDHAGGDCGQPVTHLMVPPFASVQQDFQGCKGVLSHVQYRYVSDSGRELPYRVSLHDGIAQATNDKGERI